MKLKINKFMFPFTNYMFNCLSSELDFRLKPQAVF